MSEFELHCGHVLDKLKLIESESVDCVITSPPYWGLRNYGDDAYVLWKGENNCEHEWVEFDLPKTDLKVRKSNSYKNKKAIPVLESIPWKQCKKCGVEYGQLGLEATPEMFVNHLIDVFTEIKRVLKKTGNVFVVIDDTYVSKSAMLVPEMFAMRMVYDLKYILRCKIIWAKKVFVIEEGKAFGNAMPETVNDRQSHVWEYVYHFVKKPNYYYNLDAIKIMGRREKRKVNPGNVIFLNTEPSESEHLAPFPEMLVEFCITVGCPEGGVVLDPFMGIGTTGEVALKMGRKFIGIEIVKEYYNEAEKRLKRVVSQKKLEVDIDV